MKKVRSTMHGQRVLTMIYGKKLLQKPDTDIDFYTLRERRSTDEILPWDFIDAGVTKKFLIHEWEQAKKRNRNTKLPSEMFRLWCYDVMAEVYVMKVRIKFSKEGPVKFVGHLDTMRYFQKAIRRARASSCFFRWIQSAYDHVFCRTI